MSDSLSDIQRQLLGGFFEESFEGLEHLETGLLALERSTEADSETVNDVFRVVHSIKGGAGSFGLASVSELAHSMETLLDRWRSGTLQPNPETAALLLEGVDGLRGLLEASRDEGDFPSAKVESLRERLKLAGASDSTNKPSRAEAPKKLAAQQQFLVTFTPKPQLLESGNEPVRLLRELSRLGDVRVTADTSRLPALRELDSALCYLAWTVELSGEITEAQILEVFSWVEDDADVSISQRAPTAAPSADVEADESALPAPAAEKPGDEKAGAARGEAAGNAAGRPEGDAGLGSIRVAVDKIDLLMNMVGELVITQSMLGELDDDGPLDAARIARLRENLTQLARNTRALQESVMRLRSMPISMVFNRFPRLVHDLSRQLNKHVELKIVGQTTELDKTVLEKLGDPLVHLVRNSMDHGLESPEARRAAGKPETGTLELRAYHRGGDIVVEVVDDGRGIDRERVIKRAREVGLLGPDETPGEDAIRDFIFAPGFSTAAKLSDVSGRGVGMDVVRRNIKSLGGDVFVDTTPGKGTRISLRLPLTLAIIDGQLIRVGPHSYVIPLLSIVESVQVEPKRVSRLQGRREIYRLRDQLIPMVDLAGPLGMPSTNAGLEGRLMVIVDADGERLGLVVDELLGQQQVVVKSLETNYGRVEGLAGATILGDGAVGFILDVAGVGRLARGSSLRDGARAA
jgi:two-component system chemotaxis sensor kinase CheA